MPTLWHPRAMAPVTVADNPDARRYEAHVDGALAGFAEYQLTDALVVLTHTEVEASYEGQGVGGTLARAALDAVRADGTRKVLVVCPFIKAWIDRHPDYADLLYGARPSTVTD